MKDYLFRIASNVEITETMENHLSRRGTGYLGTEIYGYRDFDVPISRLKDKRERSNAKVFAVPLPSEKKVFRPFTISRLHDASNEMTSLARKANSSKDDFERTAKEVPVLQGGEASIR